MSAATDVWAHASALAAEAFLWPLPAVRPRRFRDAVHTFADNSRHASPWAAGVYADAKARGHDHQHALRILGRAWIRVIYRCWTDGVAYDATLHGAARRLDAAAAADQQTAA